MIEGRLAQIDAELARRPRLRAPEIHEVANGVYRIVRPWAVADRDRLCEQLWKRPFGFAIVCYVYRRFNRQFAKREFRLFERWLDLYVDNWGATDGLSCWLLGGCLLNDPSLIPRLDAWTKSKNRWKRRAAAVSLVPLAKRGLNTRDIFRIAKPLIPDADDMVQKGAGWLLKETYPKKPVETVRFLMPLRTGAPRLVLRYAAEKMTQADRARVLSREL